MLSISDCSLCRDEVEPQKTTVKKSEWITSSYLEKTLPLKSTSWGKTGQIYRLCKMYEFSNQLDFIKLQEGGEEQTGSQVLVPKTHKMFFFFFWTKWRYGTRLEVKAANEAKNSIYRCSVHISELWLLRLWNPRDVAPSSWRSQDHGRTTSSNGNCLLRDHE